MTNPDKQIGKPPPAKGLAHFWRSCTYSCNGFKEACKEAAFRQELALGVIIVPLAWILPFSFMTAAILNICWLALLITELLNTAIEAVVDMTSPGYHELAKRAKDLASLAVACAIAINALAWFAALWCWLTA